MTDHNPDSGNAPGLAAHLSDMQTLACRLSGLLKALAYLENDDACREARSSLIYIAEDLATRLNNGLDVAHPQVTI